ncbi:MAG: hypothetical protein U0441_23600 [Polyangiaceae bacterium]
MGMTEEAHESPIAAPRGAGITLALTPDRGMDLHAKVGRARWFFLVAWLCSLLLGAVMALRVDARAATLEKLDMSGELATMSDRQIAEETKSAERVFQVLAIAKGATSAPVQLLGASLSILVLVWFLRGKVKGSAVLPVAAVTLVPAAVANVVDAITAFRRLSVHPDDGALAPRTLTDALMLAGRPLMPPWIKLGNAFDFYSLWAALILAFGVAAVGQVPRRRAVIGTLVAWVCVRLLTNVAAGR